MRRKIKVRKYRDSKRPHKLRKTKMKEDESRDVRVVVLEQPQEVYPRFEWSIRSNRQ